MELPDLSGKTAIVSGGERGLGQGIAAYLGRQQMNLLIAGVSEEEGEFTRSIMNDAGMKVRFFRADLSDPKQARAAVNEAISLYGEIDLLVNNAATNKLLDFTAYEQTDYDSVFEKNVRMVYHLSLACAKEMEKRKEGAIVNISSVGASRAHRQSVAYNASKGAIESMTRAMALDLAPMGLRVNAVAPGAIINRPISDKARPYREKQAAGIPLGRVGSVSDVAAMVGFLASGAASYITGQVFLVDGGLTAQLTPPGIYI